MRMWMSVICSHVTSASAEATRTSASQSAHNLRIHSSERTETMGRRRRRGDRGHNATTQNRRSDRDGIGRGIGRRHRASGRSSEEATSECRASSIIQQGASQAAKRATAIPSRCRASCSVRRSSSARWRSSSSRTSRSCSSRCAPSCAPSCVQHK